MSLLRCNNRELRSGKDSERLCSRSSGATVMAALLVAPLCALAQQDPGFVIEEITVTAQKRTERLVDVPVAISGYIPNMQISEGNDFRSTVTIRGVGATSRNIGFDSRVGVYIDGVYVGQSPAINQELLNLERVEVLRGPQGTLFGKNTVAGAINLITRKPDDELRGMASID